MPSGMRGFDSRGVLNYGDNMNINDQIECRLTMCGREVLARHYTELFSDRLYGVNSDPDYTLADRNADVTACLKGTKRGI